ncbi:uncharacterized protein VTP21DRAFT_5667 [Calcarisporiella thermophila]|uniref:uncharacterized protein n=1 Tax=Calcarisporiella thermophila TaxID=911321 RepID=UPI003743A14E
MGGDAFAKTLEYNSLSTASPYPMLMPASDNPPQSLDDMAIPQHHPSSSADDTPPSTSSDGFPRPSLPTPSSTSQKQSDENGEDKDSKPRKRLRTTPEQLAVLEDMFLSIPSPDSRLRHILAKRLGMTERSVQIWFQNRRAKSKLLQKRALMAHRETMRSQQFLATITGATNYLPYVAGYHPYRPMPGMVGIAGDPSMVAAWDPYFMGRYSPLSAASPSPSPTPDRRFSTISPAPSTGRSPSPLRADTPDLLAANAKSPLKIFTCDMLTIGTWRRMVINPMDLHCFYETSKRQMSWHIQDNQHRLKMEFPFSAITKIEFVTLDAVFAQVGLELSAPPVFYMAKEARGGDKHDAGDPPDEAAKPEKPEEWLQCSDFTEGKQASKCMRHVLRGMSIPLKMQIAELVSADPALGKLTCFEPHLATDGAYDPARRLSCPPTMPLDPASAALPRQGGPSDGADADKSRYRRSMPIPYPALSHPPSSSAVMMDAAEDMDGSIITQVIPPTPTHIPPHPLYVDTALDWSTTEDIDYLSPEQFNTLGIASTPSTSSPASSVSPGVGTMEAYSAAAWANGADLLGTSPAAADGRNLIAPDHYPLERDNFSLAAAGDTWVEQETYSYP